MSTVNVREIMAPFAAKIPAHMQPMFYAYAESLEPAEIEIFARITPVLETAMQNDDYDGFLAAVTPVLAEKGYADQAEEYAAMAWGLLNER